MAKILVVEDDVALSAVIQEWFKAENHSVDVLADGDDALRSLLYDYYDVAIVDWALPSLPGVEICRRFRAAGGTVPILMLTGKRTVDNRITGLDAGADDYLTKPFDMGELSARVRSLLRRPTVMVVDTLRFGNLQLDPKSHRVTRDGEQIELLPKEFALLEFLMRNPNQVFSSEALLERLWSAESDAGPDVVRSYVTRVRKKIDVEGRESLIKTVHRLGYKLEE